MISCSMALSTWSGLLILPEQVSTSTGGLSALTWTLNGSLEQTSPLSCMKSANESHNCALPMEILSHSWDVSRVTVATSLLPSSTHCRFLFSLFFPLGLGLAFGSQVISRLFKMRLKSFTRSLFSTLHPSPSALSFPVEPRMPSCCRSETSPVCCLRCF